MICHTLVAGALDMIAVYVGDCGVGGVGGVDSYEVGGGSCRKDRISIC